MSGKLKVLAVCHEDPKYILGGMGMHVRELYRTMAARDDVEIDLLTSGPGEGAQEDFGFTRDLSDKLICFKPRAANLAALLFADIQMLKTLNRLIATGKRWDLVHCHEWNSVQISRFARDTLGIPMVGTLHLCMSKLCEDSEPDLSEGHVYMLNQEGKLVVESDEFIACSRAYERLLKKQFMTERPMHVIYNGINLEEWHPEAGVAERGRWMVSSDNHEKGRLIALFVGRIAEMKGIIPLLDAIEAKDNGYKYVLCGAVNANTPEDAEQWEVTQRIRKLCEEIPQRLIWLDFRHGQELKDLYAAADVVVMPSIHEPFGIVALEAMAMGTPLIATEVNGLGEIVCDNDGNEYAMIIEPNSPEHILAALEELKNEESRSELRSLGLERAGAFDWHVAATETVNIYRKLLER